MTQIDQGYLDLVQRTQNPGALDKLKAASYPQDQIDAYAARTRASMTAEGKSPGDIDYYLTGIRMPDKIPEPFIQRFLNGNAIGRIFNQVGKSAAEGFGPSPLGFGEGEGEVGKELRDIGVWPSENLGGPLRFTNEALMAPAAKGFDAFMRGISAGLYGIAGFGAQSLEELGVIQKGGGEKLASETGEALNIGAMLLGSAPFYGVKKVPGGATDEPIGSMPKPQDFLTSTQSITPEAPPSTPGKMLALYNQEGIHPAEAAAAARSDITTTQNLLSIGNDIPSTKAPDPLVEALQNAPIEGADTPVEAALRNATGDVKKRLEELNAEEGTAASETERTIPSTSSEGGGGKPPAEPPSASSSAGGEPPRQIEFSGSLDDAMDKIRSQISVGEQPTKSRPTFDEIYRQTVDYLYPILKKAPEAYPTFRLLAGTNGKITHFLRNATFDFNTYENNGPGLMETLKGVDLDKLRNFSASVRALELNMRGIDTGLDLPAAHKVVSDLRGEMTEPWQKLLGYQDRVLQYYRDSGMLSPEGYTAMKQLNRGYVPFYIFRDNQLKRGPSGMGITPVDVVKFIEGNHQKLVDPIESIIRNTHMLIDVAERNAAYRKLLEVLGKVDEASGVKSTELVTRPRGEVATYADEMLSRYGASAPEISDALEAAAQPDAPGQLSVFIDGKRQTFRVDEDIAQAARGLDRNTMTLIDKFLAVPARLMRAGSVLDPTFWARFIMREPVYAAATYPGEGVVTPVDMLKGLGGLLFHGDDYWKFMKSGGAHTSFAALDRRYLQEDLRALTHSTGLMTRTWNSLLHPIQSLRMATEVVMSMGHYAGFEKGLAQAGESKAGLQTAGWLSRQTSIDNTRIGASMVALNAMSSFLNATLQEPVRLIEAAKANPAKFAAVTFAGVVLPSVLTWLANRDNPDYQNIDDWQKDLFWLFPVGRDSTGHQIFFRYPKQYGYGVLFGTGTEKLLESYFDEHPAEFDDFAKSFLGAIVPQVTPTFTGPIWEDWANKSLLNGSPMVSSRLEKMLPEYQYYPNTTETAKWLSKQIAAFPGIGAFRNSAVGAPIQSLTSPIMLENYIKSWSGTLGMRVVQGLDFALRKAGVVPDPTKPEPTISDNDFFKSFIIRYPNAGLKPVSDFYDKYSKMQEYYNTFRDRAKVGDVKALAEIQAAGGPAVFAKADSFAQALGNVSASIRLITENPTMSPAEKRQFIDTQLYAMISIGRAANSYLDALEKQRQGK